MAADYPPIESLDDLLTLEQVSEKFGIGEATIRPMRFWQPVGLPYLRFGNKVWISERQLIWFLNYVQRELPDKYYIDRKRRERAGLPLGRGRPPKS